MTFRWPLGREAGDDKTCDCHRINALDLVLFERMHLTFANASFIYLARIGSDQKH